MIRELQEKDIEAMVAIGAEMHQEGAFSGLDYNPHRMEAVFTRCLTDRDHLCLVVKKDGMIIGGIYAVLSVYFFNYDIIAEERALYVLKEHRGGIAGLKLVRAFEKWAKERGAKEIVTGSSVGIKTEKVRQFYEALGYSTRGYIFKKRI